MRYLHRFNQRAGVLLLQRRAKRDGHGEFFLLTVKKTIRIIRRQRLQKLITVVELMRSTFFLQEVLKLTVVLRRKAHAGIAHSEDGCGFKLEESSRFAGRVLQ